MRLFINKKVVKVEIADNFFKRLFGLMHKKNYDNALLLKNTTLIHTLGMKMNIDVLYLDENYNLIKYALNIKPNKILASVQGTKHIIELDSNLIINKNDYINAIIK